MSSSIPSEFNAIYTFLRALNQSHDGFQPSFAEHPDLEQHLANASIPNTEEDHEPAKKVSSYFECMPQRYSSFYEGEYEDGSILQDEWITATPSNTEHKITRSYTHYAYEETAQYELNEGLFEVNFHLFADYECTNVGGYSFGIKIERLNQSERETIIAFSFLPLPSF